MSILIKRYRNRKFYNVNIKQYIALSAIRELIRDGEDIKIIDHNSGKDITGAVIIQILVDFEKKNSGVFPPQLLLRLVQAGGRRLEEIRNPIASNRSAHFEIDREIKRRINYLVDIGELTNELGQSIIRKLLRYRKTFAGESENLNIDFVENVNEKFVHPEIFSLIKQIETLSMKVDLFNKQLLDK